MSQEKKYKILKNETLEHYGRTLYRIQAVKDFSDVKAGDKGGWVSGYHNLSQEGNCWVYNEAKVFDEAIVRDNARIRHNAKVLMCAKVCGNAMVFSNACVIDVAKVYGNARIFGDAKIYGDAWIYDKANVCENAEVFGDAHVYNYANVYDDAQIYGNVCVYGNAIISGNAVVKDLLDYITFKNNWSSGRYFTYTKSNKMWKVGCFYGTGEELIKKAYQDSELSGKMYEMFVNLVKEEDKIKEELSKS